MNTQSFICKAVTVTVITAILCGPADLLLSLNRAANAGIVDDYMNKVDKPGYSQGQRRGYLSGGGFAVRWPASGPTSLVNIESPRISIGCGGIDLFYGGLGFVNFDYLVKKFQNLLMQAPAIAFDMALSALCNQCANALSKVTAAVDWLNGLQFDECKMGQTIKAELKKGNLSDTVSSIKTSLSNASSEFWTKISESSKSNNDKDPSKLQEKVKGCKEEVKDLFSNNPSVLQAAWNLVGGLGGYNVAQNDPYFPNLIRGIIGDVSIPQDTQTDIMGAYIAPCSENSNLDLQGLVEGRVSVRKDLYGNCELLAASSSDKVNLIAWVDRKIAATGGGSLYAKLSAPGANTATLDADQVAIVETSPIPVIAATKLAVIRKDTSHLRMLVPVIAKAYAYNMFVSIMDRVTMVDKKIAEIASKQAEKTKQGEVCDTAYLQQLVSFFQTKVSHDALMFSARIREDALKDATMQKNFIAIIEQMQKMDQEAKDIVGGYLSQSLGLR